MGELAICSSGSMELNLLALGLSGNLDFALDLCVSGSGDLALEISDGGDTSLDSSGNGDCAPTEILPTFLKLFNMVFLQGVRVSYARHYSSIILIARTLTLSSHQTLSTFPMAPYPSPVHYHHFNNYHHY